MTQLPYLLRVELMKNEFPFPFEYSADDADHSCGIVHVQMPRQDYQSDIQDRGL